MMGLKQYQKIIISFLRLEIYRCSIFLEYNENQKKDFYEAVASIIGFSIPIDKSLAEIFN